MKPLRRKPSQQRSRETVDVVFEAAMRELQRGDPTAVNVNRVAETAGVSIGSIYQYFPSKETLLSSLIAHYMRRRFEAIMAMIRAIQDEERTTQTVVPLEEIMRRLVHGTIRLKQTGLPLEFALISWFARVGSLASLTELDREYTQAIADALRTLQEPPARIRSVDPLLAARILMQSIRAILLTAILQEPGLFDGEALCAEVTELAVRYLKH
ncbi:MAG TPA: TetR/AcrR family transcriptional regulator [Polyangiaceae bacterium]|nr:TetR/AcrR family transcriptional regulator [Polyangiaceae bacterium]